MFWHSWRAVPILLEINKKKAAISIVAILLTAQLILIMVQSGCVYYLGGKLWVEREDDLLRGIVYVSGNSRGTLQYLECGQLSEVMARKVGFLNKDNRSLYLDLGNYFTGDTISDSLGMPFLIDSLCLSSPAAVNVTKGDLLALRHLSEYSCPGSRKLPLLSANIEVDGNSIEIEKFRLLPLEVSNNNRTDFIALGITGIAETTRIADFDYPGSCRFLDYTSSLNEALPKIQDADIRILLANYPLFKLDGLMEKVDEGIDLIIAQSTRREIIKRIVNVKKVPVILIDEYGRELLRLEIIKKREGCYFRVEIINLTDNWPSNINATRIAGTYHERIRPITKN